MHVSQFMLLGLLAVFAAVAEGQATPRVIHLRHSRHGLEHAREVVVETQCRCNPNRCFSKGETTAVLATNDTQPASLATGLPKTFSKAVRPCSCGDGHCNVGIGTPAFLEVETRYSKSVAHEARSGTPWTEIPDIPVGGDLWERARPACICRRPVFHVAAVPGCRPPKLEGDIFQPASCIPIQRILPALEQPVSGG